MSISQTNIWICRQNPYGLRSKDFIKFIKINDIISCPFGHSNGNDVIEGQYYAEARNQDKRFVEETIKGDYIIVPIEGEKKFILKRILKNKIKIKSHRGLWLIKTNNEVKKIVNDGNLTKKMKKKYNIEWMRMAYKKCETIGEYDYDTMVDFSRQSFTKLKKEEVLHKIQNICNINF